MKKNLIKIIKNKGKNNREKESVETGMNNISRQVADYMGKLVVFLCHQRITGNE